MNFSFLNYYLLLLCLLGCGNSSSVSAVSPVTEISEKTGNHDIKASTELALNTNELLPTADFVNPITPELSAEGWISLFDGSTLFSWETKAPDAWQVKEKAIITESGEKGFLTSFVPYKDYELTLEFKANAETNSGVFIRSAFDPKNPNQDCYEINIAGRHPEGYLTGSIVSHQKASQEVKLGEWMTMTIKALGKQISVKVNDVETVNWIAPDDKFLEEGYIHLQRNAGTAAFRNIRLKPILTEQLYDGESLKGWHVVPGSKGDFKVTADKTILATGGRGFLETDGKYANFVLQFQAKTNAENLNSGLFFRLDENIEKTLSNGYEYQIHNGKKDGNPLTPLDHGTGGIFKRVNARRVIAADKTWMTCTLVASGNKFQSWVNGYPVTAWVDTRPDNKNPREGLRLEAGPFSIQAHDPTTNVEFKHFGLSRLK